MNDNTLAVVALDRLHETALREKIRAKPGTFTVFGHDAFRNHGWVDPFIHRDIYYLEPLKTQGCYRYDDSTKTFGPRLECEGGMTGIIHEEWDGSTYGDEKNYLDLSASKALSWHKQYEKTRSTTDKRMRDSFITFIEPMWKPTNLGFGKPDKDGKMTTYYLAAYLLVGEKSGWPKPFDSDRRKVVRTMLNSLQLGNGGFATWYKVQNGKVVAKDQGGNTETTSLAVYANIQPQEYCDFSLPA